MITITRRTVLVLLALMSIVQVPVHAGKKDCARSSIGLAPSSYVSSHAHTAAGVAAAQAIVPRDVDGRPASTGLIGFINIGMSNAGQIYQSLGPLLRANPDRHPALRIVQAAKSGADVSAWSQASSEAWSTAMTQTRHAGLAPAQVQAIHIIMAKKSPQKSAAMTEIQLRAVLDIAVSRFPHLSVAVWSGVNYTGYAGPQSASPEPYPHDDSLLIAAMVTTALPVWSDLLDIWADGAISNPITGLAYQCTDVASDGAHLSSSGRRKVADSLFDRLTTDPVTRGWMH